MKRIIVASVLLAAPALAQSSASFRLTEHVFNAGGDPSQGSAPSSVSFRITLDAIGDNAGEPGLASASFRSDPGFAVAFRPPGEVKGLRFHPDQATLAWDPEPSVGDYAAYRDTLSGLAGLGFGACWQHGITAATATDASSPSTGQGFFYLVTARNRLREEGTKGWRSGGVERSNASPCP